MTEATTLADTVRDRYAQAAQQVREGAGRCCSPGGDEDPITTGLYSDSETNGLPEEALLASLGCGNPTALIDLREGETVLDLGSGGGIDVLLSAKRVGPSGFAYGVDMTDEMLALALENKKRAGTTNVAFLKGRIEDIPLPKDSVDVVISNCVINLAADKSLVLQDAYRVLRPGGRFAVADVVAEEPLPSELRRDMEAWAGCLAGALEVDTYRGLLEHAGFEDISVEITRRFPGSEAGADHDDAEGRTEGDGLLVSAFIRAAKPDKPRDLERKVLATSGRCRTSGCCR